MARTKLKKTRMRLKKRRLEKKLTQERLAEKVGICRNFYCEIENGIKGCSVETWLKIGEALEIPKKELILYVAEGIEKGEAS